MIRLAHNGDLERITEIYNQAIDARFQTGFIEPLVAIDRVGWFEQHTPGKYPLFVFEIDNQVVGWLSISPYRQGRGALRYSVEVSYFLHNHFTHRGIGSQLLAHSIDACKSMRYKSMIAIIIDKNKASIGLMEKFGFEKWAHLPGVIEFDGVECDHVYYGLKL